MNNIIRQENLKNWNTISDPEWKKARLISKKWHKLTVLYRDRTLWVFDESEVVHVKDHAGKEKRKEEQNAVEKMIFQNERRFQAKKALENVEPKNVSQAMAKTSGRVHFVLSGKLPNMSVREDKEGAHVLNIGNVSFIKK